MLSFANESDTELVNRPKVSAFLKFYINKETSKKILHSVQLGHTTNEHSKLH